jgi:predicted nucleic acid-binding protein
MENRFFELISVLPDCLIASTAKFYGATLVSFDLKDFPMDDIKKIKI